MDWLTFFEKVINSIVWPIVVVATLWKFKAVIVDLVSGLVKRLEAMKIGKNEWKFLPAQQQQEILEEAKGQGPAQHGNAAALPDMEVTLLMETQARDFIAEGVREIGDKDRAIELLSKNLAYCRVFWYFDRIYYTIFGSQLRLVAMLNGMGSAGSGEQIPRLIYDEAVRNNPQTYAAIPFERWVEYLVSNNLIVVVDGQYVITSSGEQFLKFIPQTGKLFERAG